MISDIVLVGAFLANTYIFWMFGSLLNIDLNMILLHLLLMVVFVFLVGLLIRNLSRKNRENKVSLEKCLEEMRVSNKSLQEAKYQLELRDKFFQEALVLVDENGIVYYLNKQVSEIFGRPDDKILYQHLPAWVCSEVNNPLNTPGRIKPGLNYSSMVQYAIGGEIHLFKTKWSFYPTSEGKEGVAIVFHDFTELLEAERKCQQLLIEKNEINKQLSCLFDICDVSAVPDITFEGILERALLIIPYGLKFTHDAWVEISYANTVLRSQNFMETSWYYTAPIKARNKKLGYVKVGYLTEKPSQNRDAFHLNEKLLIKTIAEKLGHVIDYLNIEQKLATCDGNNVPAMDQSKRTKKPPPAKKGAV